MSFPEQRAYERFLESRRIEMSVKETAAYEGFQDGMEKGLEQGREEGENNKAIEVVQNAIKEGANNSYYCKNYRTKY